MFWKPSLNDRSFEYRISRLLKRVYNRLRLDSRGERKILFVIGCQRSGTSLLMRVFETDFDTKVFSEFSKLTNQDRKDRIRLNPLPSVRRDLENERAPLMIIKPLVETQNALKLLEYFDNSKALWMYRDYKDVISSNVKLFGAEQAKSDVRDMVEGNQSSWRGEFVPDHVRRFVAEHFSDDIGAYDLRALFWYARNSLFFDLALQDHPRVMMCKYEDFVRNPLQNIRRIYDFLDHRVPAFKASDQISVKSLGKGQDVGISPAIEEGCRRLMQRLDDVYGRERSIPSGSM